MKAEALFPTVIWSNELNDSEKLNETLVERAYALKEEVRESANLSNVLGWQSGADVQTREEFADITKMIGDACVGVAQSENFSDKVEYVLEAWININPTGSSNKEHIHPGSLFSGVYYIQAEGEESGLLYFRDPRTAASMLNYPVDEDTPFTSQSFAIMPKSGNIHIFPSWLAHGVDVNKSSKDRISIAFNMAPVPKRRD